MSRETIVETLIAAARSQAPAAFLNVRAGDLLAALDPEFAPNATDEPTGDEHAGPAADV